MMEDKTMTGTLALLMGRKMDERRNTRATRATRSTRMRSQYRTRSAARRSLVDGEHCELLFQQCPCIRILRRDLQGQSQRLRVEGLVQGDQRAVHAGIAEIPGICPQADLLHPTGHAIAGPDENICNTLMCNDE